MEIPFKMDDLGVSLFSETPILFSYVWGEKNESSNSVVPRWWFKATFWFDPLIGGHDSSHKRSRKLTIQKKVTTWITWLEDFYFNIACKSWLNHSKFTSLGPMAEEKQIMPWNWWKLWKTYLTLLSRKFQKQHLIYRWWQLKYFLSLPRTLGWNDDPIWQTRIFFKGVGEPTTNHQLSKISFTNFYRGGSCLQGSLWGAGRHSFWEEVTWILEEAGGKRGWDPNNNIESSRVQPWKSSTIIFWMMRCNPSLKNGETRKPTYFKKWGGLELDFQD